jgi:hypothetical protein
MILSTTARLDVHEHYAMTGTWLSTTSTASDLTNTEDATQEIAQGAVTVTFPHSKHARLQGKKLIGNYVKQINIQQGAIHIKLGNRINAHVESKVVTLRPAVVTGSPESPISWLCGYAQPVTDMQAVGSNLTDIAQRYLPLTCRRWES